MFEKEEELTTIDHKELRYPVLFLKKLFQYRKKKVHLASLEIWTGNRCSLRCQHCISFLPYVAERKVSCKKTLRSLRRILTLVTVDRLIIGGGEPLGDQRIWKLIEEASACDSITRIQIYSSGTDLPSDRVIQALKASKVHVFIQQYPGIEDQAEVLLLQLRKAHVSCSYHSPVWKMLGGPFQQRLHFETVKVLFQECSMKQHAVLFDGEFTACPRGIHTRTVLGMPKNPWEHLNVFRLRSGTVSRARIATAMDPGWYKDYCLYCLGMSPENPYRVIPGEQYPEKFERKNES